MSYEKVMVKAKLMASQQIGEAVIEKSRIWKTKCKQDWNLCNKEKYEDKDFN